MTEPIDYDCEDMQPFKCPNCGVDKMFRCLPDSCLGMLPGVVDACCGHGDISKAYVHFQDGTVLLGFTIGEKMEPSEELWKIDTSKVCDYSEAVEE